VQLHGSLFCTIKYAFAEVGRREPGKNPDSTRAV
jgi:hypothetical protein